VDYPTRTIDSPPDHGYDWLAARVNRPKPDSFHDGLCVLRLLQSQPVWKDSTFPVLSKITRKTILLVLEFCRLRAATAHIPDVFFASG
jgi:hypothetical protein